MEEANVISFTQNQQNFLIMFGKLLEDCLKGPETLEVSFTKCAFYVSNLGEEELKQDAFNLTVGTKVVDSLRKSAIAIPEEFEKDRYKHEEVDMTKYLPGLFERIMVTARQSSQLQETILLDQFQKASFIVDLGEKSLNDQTLSEIGEAVISVFKRNPKTNTDVLRLYEDRCSWS